MVRHAGRLVQGMAPWKHVVSDIDGDLLLLVEGMLDKKGSGLTRVSMVKDYAGEEVVASGQVGALDKVGNDQAVAADYGRGKIPERVIAAWGVWSLVSCCAQCASALCCHCVVCWISA